MLLPFRGVGTVPSSSSPRSDCSLPCFAFLSRDVSRFSHGDPRHPAYGDALSTGDILNVYLPDFFRLGFWKSGTFSASHGHSGTWDATAHVARDARRGVRRAGPSSSTLRACTSRPRLY